ncbi:MAG: hypothetical protein IJW60_03545 [Clostridia bacterium]|nr:hypothetical protein [Clostridia bacterium]
MEKFAIGLLLGGVVGALITTNNYKMRTLVKRGQEEVQAKLDELMDEKLRAFEDKDSEKKSEKEKEKKEDGKVRKARAEK